MVSGQACVYTWHGWDARTVMFLVIFAIITLKWTEEGGS